MIQYLKLVNFRSYKEEVFEFKKGINIIVGKNGSGKTNILEAIHFIATKNPFRGQDEDCVKNKQKFFTIEAEYNEQIRTIYYDLESKKKVMNINHKKINVLTTERTIPVILFEPTILSLLHNSKDKRRKYLDNLTVKINPNVSSIIKQFNKTLIQRNKLLKNKHSESELFVWNLKFCYLSGLLVKERIKTINLINKKLSEQYNNFSKRRNKIELKYISNIKTENYENNLFRKIKKDQNAELAAGFCLFGPQREDIEFYSDNKVVKSIFSRGEVRSLILSLKLTEKSILEERYNQPCIYLFDDVFSELDGYRRSVLLNQIKDNQCFITTTEPDMLLNKNKQNFNLIPIRQT